MPKPTGQSRERASPTGERVVEGVVGVDLGTVLPLTPRSFAVRVQGAAMIQAGIRAGDIAVGEHTPVARPGELVIALVDGAPVLRQLMMHRARPYLVRAHPGSPDPIPVSELVIQGVVHTLVRKIKNDGKN